MSINSCCSWFVFCLVKIIGKVNTFRHIFVYLMISLYNESLICDCDGAEILRTQHFVVVCEHTSIHDDILSSLRLGVKSAWPV